MKQSLGSGDRRHKAFENVKLDPDVVVGVSVPELGVRLGVRHEGEHDVLDDLEHVGLDQLSRVGVRHSGVDVVDVLLHHAGPHVQLPPVLVKVPEHGGEVPLLIVLRYHTENSLYVLLRHTSRASISAKILTM